MRPSGGAGQPTKPPRQKRGPSKSHRKATAAAHGSGPSVAEPEDELNALRRELREAREQQAATFAVLKTISNSPDKLELVFEPLLSNATRLCNAEFGMINLYDGEVFRNVAMHNVPPAYAEIGFREVIWPHPESTLAQMVRTQRAVQSSDYKAEAPYREGHPTVVALVDIGGARTIVAVPMLQEDTLIGAIGIYRQEVRPFTDRQLELLENFASQAVIAIENSRLIEAEQERTRELTEALRQQTATADVLQVISGSAFDLQPVFDTVAESSVRLCDAERAFIRRYDGELLHIVADFNAPPELKKWVVQNPIRPGRHSAAARAALEHRTVHVPDIQTDPEYTYGARDVEPVRTVLAVPILKGDNLLGIIFIYRLEVRPFTDKHIALVETFADQAAIAIENVRLFDEARARTEELAESLEQQTATAEVLKVISSSPGELEPVFDAILENAVQICGAKFGSLVLFEGDSYRRVASHNAPTAYVEAKARDPVRPLATSPTLSRVATTKQVIQVTDMGAEEPEEALARLGGTRTVLCVPMLKDNRVVGAISIFRQEVCPFTDKQTELVANFSAQAVIAIENTRLLNELRESLQQQTATADVLKVISRSTFDLQAVLDTLVESATRLCNADHVWLFQHEGEFFRWVAGYGHAPDMHAQIKEYFRNPLPVHQGSITGRTLLEARVIHVPDVLAEYTWNVALQVQKLGNYRAALGVPLMRKDNVIGVIFLAKRIPGPFTPKQIELATTFADQAVIAIENTRLLNELRESLQQQTATADVLKVISRSAFNLPTVLRTLVESAARLCEADKATIIRRKGVALYITETYGFSQDFLEAVKDMPIEPTLCSTASKRARANWQNH